MNPSKTTQEAVDRAITLGVLAFRSRFEGARLTRGADYDHETATAMAAGVTEWLREAGLWSSILDSERAVLELPPLTWPRDVTLALQSAGLEESVGALLFGLGVLDGIPAYDQRFDAEPLLRRLPFLSDSPFVTREGMSPREEHSSMSRSVKLRSRARIEEEERRAGLYWWRARSHSLVRAGRLDGGKLDATLAGGVSRSRTLGIPVDDRGEFLVFGARYVNLDAERFALCSLLAESRIRALRWLLSDSTWMDVDMSS